MTRIPDNVEKRYCIHCDKIRDNPEPLLFNWNTRKNDEFCKCSDCGRWMWTFSYVRGDGYAILDMDEHVICNQTHTDMLKLLETFKRVFPRDLEAMP